MKHTPLILRLLGGILLGALIIASFAIPMLGQGECVSLLALAELGKPYIFGKEGPDSFDCSGLIRYAYGCTGVGLVHSAKYIAYDGQYETIVDVNNLLPGDLIFFDTVRDSDQFDHVGIWLGMNRFVHASSEQERVMVSSFDSYWQSVHSGSRRIISHCPYSQIQDHIQAQ